MSTFTPLSQTSKRNNTPESRGSWLHAVRFEPEALWLIGSLIILFGVLIGGSNSAQRAFLGEPWSVGAVAVWSVAGLLFSAAVIFFFATIARSPAYKFKTPSLFLLLLGGFYALVHFSGVTDIALLVGQLLEWNLLWLSPVLTELGAVFGAVFAFLIFRIFRKTIQHAPTSPLFSVAGGLFLFGTYFMASIHVLPPGVNSHFVADTWLLLWGLALLILSGISPSAGGYLRRSPSVHTKSRWQASDFLFAIVPMIPIIRYSIVNVDLLPGGGIFFLYGVTAALALVLVIVVPRSLGALLEPNVLIPMSSAALFIFYNMASFSGSRSWYESGNVFEQIAILVAVTLALALFSKIRTAFFALGLLLIIVLEIVLAIGQSGESEERASNGSLPSAAPSWLDSVKRADWTTSPNVFFLTYESYANQETMSMYGIDNSEQMEFLLEEGFTIYDGSYSLGGHSLASLSRVLDVSSEPPEELLVTSGNSLVNEVFRSRGYETHGVFASDYFLRGQEPGYSTVYPSLEASNVAETSFLRSIFRGEFRFEDSFVSTDYNTYLEAKREILSLDSTKPQFLWSHSSYPGHTQNSGTCLPDEVEKYSEGLEEANAEMSFDLSEVNDIGQSIVIISGDHGPYLTKNCAQLGGYPAGEIERLDIQDRYGTFLAIRWPEGIDSSVEIEVLQNVFPAVFDGVSESGGIFESAKVVSDTKEFLAGAVYVNEGIISGGQDDGEPLFLNRDKRSLR